MGQRVRYASLTAAATVLAVVLAFLAEWLDAFGPAMFSDHWAGGVLRFALWGGAIVITGFGALRYGDRLPVFLGSFAALGVALFATHAFVTGWALAERGQTTGCTVLEVAKRVETTTDADGDPETRTYHDHRLRCDTAEITAMTTGGEPAGEARQRIEVRYDPTGRLDPRPVTDVLDPGAMLWLAGAGLAVAVVLRGGAELRGIGSGVWEPAVLRFGIAMYALGVVWLAAYLAALAGISRLLDRYGIGPLPTPLRWAGTAVLAGVTAVACRRLALWLLARYRTRLDPGGEIREVVGMRLVGPVLRGIVAGRRRRR